MVKIRFRSWQLSPGSWVYTQYHAFLQASVNSRLICIRSLPPLPQGKKSIFDANPWFRMPGIPIFSVCRPQLRLVDSIIMTAVTQILNDIEKGNAQAADQLLPLVYEELRKLAMQKLAQEKPGQTLQATALVHEAYVRLVDVNRPQEWNSRGHFFAAAAEAMRRILVEQARHKRSAKAGGQRKRRQLHDEQLPVPS